MHALIHGVTRPATSACVRAWVGSRARARISHLGGAEVRQRLVEVLHLDIYNVFIIYNVFTMCIGQQGAGASALLRYCTCAAAGNKNMMMW